MEISAVKKDILSKGFGICAAFMFAGQKDFTGILGDKFKHAAEKGHFAGKELQLYEVNSEKGRVLLVGLGEIRDYESSVLRRAVSASSRLIARQGYADAVLYIPPEAYIGDAAKTVSAITETVILSLHSSQLFKTKDREEFKLDKVSLVLAEHEGAKDVIARAKTVADAVNFAKDMINTPSNIATPEYVVNAAKKTLKKVSFTVLGRKEAAKENLNLFDAVSKGSRHEPQFLVMEYKPPKARNRKPYCLIGKGITFDTGGVSLKTPSTVMRNMKDDMSGAASVISALKVLSDLNSDKWVVGIAPLCENAIGSGSYKVDDVIKSHFGLTVEVANTDAEGRLILADALSYARRFKPEFIVDVATLTGAARIALGDKGACLMSNDENLAGKIEVCSFASGERVWRLPLWKEYNDLLKGDVADLVNINEGSPGPGTIIGGLFLQNFVEPGQAWAHLDIAAVAFYDKEQPLSMKGASGFGIRTLVELVEKY